MTIVVERQQRNHASSHHRCRGDGARTCETPCFTSTGAVLGASIAKDRMVLAWWIPFWQVIAASASRGGRQSPVVAVISVATASCTVWSTCILRTCKLVTSIHCTVLQSKWMRAALQIRAVPCNDDERAIPASPTCFSIVKFLGSS